MDHPTNSMGDRPPPPPGEPTDGVETSLTSSLPSFFGSGTVEAPCCVDGDLHMTLKIANDEHFQTRLICEAQTYLTLVDGSVQHQLVSTVYFSIFSGKPSLSFPGDENMWDQWLKEWHTCSLKDEPYKSAVPDKELVWAVRALYNKDGSLLGRSIKTIYAGPQKDDTLIYISKIFTEQAFSGKGLLRPTLDLLYRAVTHKDLARLCPISGPVCWMLEPGFINTDENEKMWPKLPGEDDWARMNRVTRILINKVYPKVHYEVYREEFASGPTRRHTYMGRRLMVHPASEGSATGTVIALDSDYPPEPPNNTKASRAHNTEAQVPQPTSAPVNGLLTPQSSAEQLRLRQARQGDQSSPPVGEEIVVAGGEPEATSSHRPNTNARANRKRKAEELEDDDGDDDDEEFEPKNDEDEDSDEEPQPVQQRQRQSPQRPEPAQQLQRQAPQSSEGARSPRSNSNNERQPVQQRQRQVPQRSEGARPLRSNYTPQLNYATEWREPGLAIWKHPERHGA
ncbi:hypothetical protein N0V93_007998 [Gnomoniopsis smithogilvyi]|uniref:Uncharacterized protein n=1 Tax=Gnomoniopsis smithogilvyi TaxID=1191159 RepID=A0A9W9CTH1_9PEZI|nr:hypothetical protein N0V93_007998 [Gnomoniopsis smithogilvyi]